jgi:hypothetical protein
MALIEHELVIGGDYLGDDWQECARCEGTGLVSDDLTAGRFSKPNTMHQVIIEAVREAQDRDDADARDEGAEGFAAWLEGCGYPPSQGAASWAEMLRGYRAYVREAAIGGE